MEVEEESPRGTLVGYLSAYDPDVGENALIDYIITGTSNQRQYVNYNKLHESCVENLFNFSIHFSNNHYK